MAFNAAYTHQIDTSRFQNAERLNVVGDSPINPQMKSPKAGQSLGADFLESDNTKPTRSEAGDRAHPIARPSSVSTAAGSAPIWSTDHGRDQYQH
jgi:hypothetical protein